MTETWHQTLARLTVSIGLLAIAFFGADRDVTLLVIGALTGYWLRAGESRALIGRRAIRAESERPE